MKRLDDKWYSVYEGANALALHLPPPHESRTHMEHQRERRDQRVSWGLLLGRGPKQDGVHCVEYKKTGRLNQAELFR